MKQRAIIAERKCRSRRRLRTQRIIRGTVHVKLALVFVALMLAAGFYLRLAGGPLSLEGYTSRLAEALAARIGPGWSVAIRAADLDLVDGIPAVRTAELVIRNPEGDIVVRAPHATVSVEPLSLLFGRPSPRDIELRDLQLRAQVDPDGVMAFAASDAPPVAAPTAPAAPLPRDASERLGVVLGAALQPLLRATSLFGALSQASLVDAKLTLVDQDGRELAAFGDVDARYADAGNGERDIQVQIEGRHGRWLLGGKVRSQEGVRTVDLRAESVPVADITGALGIETAGATSNLKLWAKASIQFSGDKVVSLQTELESSGGAVARPGKAPIAVERLSAEARWTSESGLIELPRLDVAAGGSAFRLAGTLVSAPDGAWQVKLGGRDITVAGATPGDKPVLLASASLAASIREGAASIETLSLKGDTVDVAISGASRTGPDGRDLEAQLVIGPSELRSLLALWPEGAASELRAYLKSHVPKGRLDQMVMKVGFDPAGLKAALADLPMPDGSIDGRFKASEGQLKVVDGMPALTALAVEGSFTGTRVQLAAKSARMTMPDGRRLSLEDGSYEQADYDSRDTVARIGVRAAGPADAFASLLRSPALVEAGAPEVDPATIRGRGDVRVSLSLPVRKLPIRLQAMPLTVSGTLAELSVDKIVGQEKLEGGNLSVTVDSQMASLKGQANLSGLPAQIDLQAPRTGGPAEATVTLVLDEGSRSRRSLPVGPMLGGPIPIRVTASFGAGLRSSARIEADLSRASVDNLVPGWTKAAGRPGRLSFLVGENDPLDLRDLSLESGSVQMKGHVAFSPGGALERADLSSFRLSPGDDLRASIEKAGGGYRVTVRGNNGDARPLMKWAMAAPDRKGGKDAPDLDLDLAVNILTGHDSEALTGVTARFATRNREIRSLLFGGRIQKSAVEARLARPDAGDPVVVLESGDAGATMRFLDLYRRAQGGKLSLQARVGEGVQDGVVTIDGFRLRGEPALRQLVSESAPVATETTQERVGQVDRIDPGEVQFTKLTADFRRTAARVDFREVVMWGPQIGFNLAGWLDPTRDTMDITGTFVPAYALNNAFSQVPIVGLFLGGGRNEGLFAIDFRAAGPTGAPKLTVNPLTAMAPGILRKFLGLMMPPGGAPPQVTGTVPERRGVPIQ